MQNDELSAIAASMQEAIHRAYALGRGDALRRVVEMVQTDGLSSKAMVLLGPADEPAPLPDPAPMMTEPTPIAAGAPTLSEGQPPRSAAPSYDVKPWWRRKLA